MSQSSPPPNKDALDLVGACVYHNCPPLNPFKPKVWDSYENPRGPYVAKSYLETYKSYDHMQKHSVDQWDLLIKIGYLTLSLLYLQ